jgi:hypothetical protein
MTQKSGNNEQVVSVTGKTSDEAIAKFKESVDDPANYIPTKKECSSGLVTLTYERKE